MSEKKKSTRLNIGTSLYAQRTADRVESDMREAHNLVMEPLMHKLALVTATVKDEQEENQL